MTVFLAPVPLVNPKSDKVWLPKDVELGRTTDVVITPPESAWSEFRTVGVDCRVITTHSNGVNPEKVRTILSPGAGELLGSARDSGSDCSTCADGGATGKIEIEFELALSPTMFLATTTTVYSTLFTRPVNSHRNVVVVEQVFV